MAESIPPSSRQESNKGVLLLMVGGVVLLIAAVVVLYMERSGEPEPVKQPPPPVADVGAPAPLVVAPVTAPIAKKLADAGPSVLVDKPKTGKRRGGSSGPAERMGTIDPKEVSRFMNARFSQVKACYERRLKVNPMLEGKLDLNIGVSSKGRVTSVSKNQDSLHDEVVWNCVRTAIKKWDFPKPVGGRVVVAKTFNFKKKL